MSEKHHVKITSEQRECCRNPAHTKTVATCSCGWTDSVVPGSLSRRTIGDAINGHRVAVLEAAAGIRFKVEPARASAGGEETR